MHIVRWAKLKSARSFARRLTPATEQSGGTPLRAQRCAAWDYGATLSTTRNRALPLIIRSYASCACSNG